MNTGLFTYSQRSDNKFFQEDTEMTFLDNPHPSSPTRWGDFWIDTLTTRYPL